MRLPLRIQTDQFPWKRQSDGEETWYTASGPVYSLECVRASRSGLWRCDLFDSSTQLVITRGDEHEDLATAIRLGEERFGARLEETVAEIVSHTARVVEVG